jgi:hypothetical protein
MLVLACFVVLETQWGRDRAARLLEGQFDEAVDGSMSIERITDIRTFGFGGVDVEGIVFRDPEGRVIIRAEEGSVRLDVPMLVFEKKLHFYYARANGAEVYVYPGRGYTTSLEAAFRNHRRTGPPPIDIETGPIHFQSTKLEVHMPGAPEMRFVRASGFLGVMRYGATKARLRFDRLAGSWREPSPLGFQPDIVGLHGVVQTGPNLWLEMSGRLCLRRGNTMGLQVVRRGDRTRAILDPDGIGAGAMTAFANLIGGFINNLDVERNSFRLEQHTRCPERDDA